MSEPTTGPDQGRFRPHAAGAMAAMFDDVSGRYDLLNRLMSLGQDAAWRRRLWAAVPGRARVVLDLCTGSGVSLAGLRRPGRLVVGADVSLQMLEVAAGALARSGWAPRLLCADAFQLPFADGSIDAVTVAFGVRNLRPRPAALRELARVLRPGGTLAVLEATAPRPGPLAPLHRFYLRRIVPLAGRLSPDPTAYRYLGASILDFGDGTAFEADLDSAGFAAVSSRSFLFGATRLWAVRRRPADGQIASNRPAGVHPAREEDVVDEMPPARQIEWRIWTAIQATLSAALLATLGFAAWAFSKSSADLPLSDWQRPGAWALLVLGIVIFGIRTLVLAARLAGGPPRP